MSVTSGKNRSRQTNHWFFWLFGAAILAFILLLVGFWQHYPSLQEVLYASANLLLNSEFIKPDEMSLRNGWIKGGQFFGYITFYGLLLRLTYLAFGEPLRRMYIRRFYRQHVIVCSLNEQGQAFISNLRQTHNKTNIVVLISESDADQVLWCQHQGVALLQGDARFAADLQSVGVCRAAILIACSHSAEVNLNIAYTVQQTLTARRSRKPLKLYMALSDNLLSHGLGNESYQHFLQPCDRLNPYLYNAEMLVTRDYFNQYPPHTWADWYGQKQVHLVFAGFSPLVEALICQYARISPYKDFAPPIFTLLGTDAEQYRAQLLARYPALGDDRTGAEQVIGGLHAFYCDDGFMLNDGQLQAVATLAPVTAVLFCAAEDDFNFSRGMALHQQTLLCNRWHVPFYLHICRNEGMQALLTSAISKYPARQLIPFGMAEQVFDLDKLAEVERNAEFVHEFYRTPHSEGRDPATLEDRFKAWDALPETYRSANRRAGDHIVVKLASINCHVKPGKSLILDDSITLTQPAEREEFLSRLEHRSWRYERLLAGWRYGKPRHDVRRIHPSIQLWDELPDDEKYKDVRQIESVRQALKAHSPGAAVTVRQEIVVGLIGHNFVTMDQVRNIRQQLRDRVLPALHGNYANYFFTLVTPLAPGSDFILAQAALEWFKEQGIPHRLLIVQAITLDKVVADYQDNWERGGSWDGFSVKQHGAEWKQDSKVILTQLESFISRQDACEAVIDLTLEGGGDEGNPVAYQRAAGWVVEQAGELVAVYDPVRGAEQSGGLAETVGQWRQTRGHPAIIIQ